MPTPGRRRGEPSWAAPSPADADRPLTLRETWDDFARWMGRTRWQRPIAAAALVVAGALTWAIVSVVVPWPEGILGTVQRVLAMDVGWAPLPTPDDPRLGADLSVVMAALGGSAASRERVLVRRGVSPRPREVAGRLA